MKLPIIDMTLYQNSMIGGAIGMAKAPTVARWLLNLTLVFVGLVMVFSAWLALSTLVAGDGAGIMLPVSFDAPGLSVDHDVLGRGEILGASGSVVFPDSPSGLMSFVYVIGTMLAFVPGLVLVLLLRKIVISVGNGEPFIEANVRRIRAIGIITVAAEFIRGLGVLAIQAWVADSVKTGIFMTVDVRWNLAILVLGAVIISLAEVFRYGMQLQSDADLTV